MSVEAAASETGRVRRSSMPGLASILSIAFAGSKGLAGKIAGMEKRLSLALRRLLADASGATAIEYGLICAMIALAIIAAVGTTGDKLVAAFTSLLAWF
jgi:pilus assembly protein Flp/PilA